MTAPDPGRRRLLALLGAAIGAAAVGAVAWWRDPGAISTDTPLLAGTSAPSSTTSTSTSTSTLPPATTTTAAPTTTTAAPTTTTAAGTVITVIGRDGWGARPSSDELEAHSITRVTVHHTGVVLATNAEAPAAIRRHQDFHIDSRGWPDLAYHYMIDAAGNVYQGRHPDFAGDSRSYDTTGHLLVCCEGHFGRQVLPDAQRVSLEAMVAWALAAYDVAADTIAGHGDYARTSCPGDALRTLIADGTLQQTVTARLAAGGHTQMLVTGDEAAALVSAIEG
ncbi:MAG: peptidoglycan recognition protein family protein [Actinomycetota bacterium]|nr:peptidoglycan recognition protein family protein [Actinomycetota bacterium]